MASTAVAPTNPIRLVVIALAAGIVITGYRVEWLDYLGSVKRDPGSIVGISRRPLREDRDPLPADLAAALGEAGRRMQFGETIALAYGPPADHYSWAWYRSVYELAPRRVLPPARLDDSRLATNLRTADYILVWNQPLEVPNADVILKTDRAVLLKARK
jgi:hypothetical protein